MPSDVGKAQRNYLLEESIMGIVSLIPVFFPPLSDVLVHRGASAGRAVVVLVLRSRALETKRQTELAKHCCRKRMMEISQFRREIKACIMRNS